MIRRVRSADENRDDEDDWHSGSRSQWRWEFEEDRVIHQRILSRSVRQSFTLIAIEHRRVLDGRMQKFADAMKSISWASVFWTSMPIDNLLSKRPTQLWLSSFGLIFFATTLPSIFVDPAYSGIPQLLRPMIRADTLRFTPLQLRNGSAGEDIHSPGIGSFHLLRDRLPLPDYEARRSNITVEGREMLLRFEDFVNFNGWYVITGSHDPSGDAVSFSLSGRTLREGGTEPHWETVGGSGFESGSMPTLGSANGTAPTRHMPLQRLDRLMFDYSIGIEHWIVRIVGFTCAGVMGVGSGVAGFLHKPQIGRNLFAAALAVFGSILMWSSFNSFAQWGFAEPLTIVLGCLNFIQGLQIFFWQKMTWPLAWITGFIVLVLGLTQPDRVVLGVTVCAFVLTTVFLSFGFYMRRTQIASAWKIFKSDFEMYSNLWEELLKDEASLVSLQSLDTIAQSLKASTGNPSLHRQLQRRRVTEGRGGGSEAADDGDGEDEQLSSNSRAPQSGQAARKGRGALVMLRLFGGLKVRASNATGTQIRTLRDLEQGTLRRRPSVASSHRSTEHLPTSPSHRRDDLIKFMRGGSGRFSEASHQSAWQDIDVLDAKTFGTGFLGYRTVPGEVDDGNPVTSIDQLYIQASALHPLLQHLVIKWASVSSGMFLYRGFSASKDHQGVSSNAGPHNQRSCDTFESWEHAKIRFIDEEFKFTHGVKWAQLKKPGRAFEKVMRKHRGDVSRVLDICRQSITFKTVQDVELCLKAIAADPTVKIVRLKNRMSLEDDARDTGGYRDCLINLRILEENAVALGLDTHVCEVQLILESFAKQKTSDGHKRYVKFRNMKAE